jgi:ParB family chromosome partitioning protein
MKKGGLGSGLSALFQNNNVVSVDVNSDSNSGGNIENGVETLPLDRIIPDNLQPRKEFEEGSLAALAESIRVHGVLQPIVVRPIDGVKCRANTDIAGENYEGNSYGSDVASGNGGNYDGNSYGYDVAGGNGENYDGNLHGSDVVSGNGGNYEGNPYGSDVASGNGENYDGNSYGSDVASGNGENYDGNSYGSDVAKRNGKNEQLYKIVAGERRYRASKIAGLSAIPAVVRELSDFESSQLALIENLQREDLNPTEIAVGYKNLIDNFAMTQEELSKNLGISRSQVANYLRLLTLSDDVFELLKQGRISVGHAKVLLSIEDKKKQSETALMCADDKMTVRALERLLKENSGVKIGKKIPAKDEYYIEVENFLQSKLGRKVVIGKKSIVIEFNSQEDLSEILDKLS